MNFAFLAPIRLASLMGALSRTLLKGARNLAWWLLALETVGGALLLGAAEYMNMPEFELSTPLVFASIVLVAWTLPNSAILYKARGLFAEPKGKPGV